MSNKVHTNTSEMNKSFGGMAGTVCNSYIQGFTMTQCLLLKSNIVLACGQ